MRITITHDEKKAQWARAQAARRGMSLSSFLRELLEERMAADDQCREAMRGFLSRKPTGKWGAPYPSREEIHDRWRPR